MFPLRFPSYCHKVKSVTKYSRSKFDSHSQRGLPGNRLQPEPSHESPVPDDGRLPLPRKPVTSGHHQVQLLLQLRRVVRDGDQRDGHLQS